MNSVKKNPHTNLWRRQGGIGAAGAAAIITYTFVANRRAAAASTCRRIMV